MNKCLFIVLTTENRSCFFFQTVVLFTISV